MTALSIRRAAPLLAGLLVAACGGGTPSPSQAPVIADPTAASTAPATAGAAAPSPTAPPAIVGVWVGVHQCQRIMDVMTAAGMPEQGLLNILDAGTLPGVTALGDIPDPEHPCVGAIEVKHSHFFTAAGEFGSRDSIGTRVDDGTWRLSDSDTIVIGDVPFDFTIENDALRLVPLDVGTCPTGTTEWCEEAWKLMVAMPGLEWHRG